MLKEKSLSYNPGYYHTVISAVFCAQHGGYMQDNQCRGEETERLSALSKFSERIALDVLIAIKSKQPCSASHVIPQL